MIKDAAAWRIFDKNRTKLEKPDYERNRLIFAALWHEALTLGALPLADPMAGIDVDIRVASTLNGCLKKP